MNETLTTPIPLLRNGDNPEFANRLAPPGGVVAPFFSDGEEFSTRFLGKLEFPLRQNEELTIEAVYALALSFFLRAKQAEATGESSRPISLLESREALCFPGLQLGHWVRQMTSERTRPIIPCAVPNPQEALTQPEFGWSVSIYNARKAARDFSEETHADY
ncbi:MAG: hypothetical protein ACYC3I_12985 [Gemmataceae bacterium]